MNKAEKDAMMSIALSAYLGEKCKYCGKEYKTISDLNDAVWYGIHENGRLACSGCYKKNNGGE